MPAHTTGTPPTGHTSPGNPSRPFTHLWWATRARATTLVAQLHRDTSRLRYIIGIPGALAVTTVIFSQMVALEVETILDTHTEKLAVLIGCATLMLLLAFQWARALPSEQHTSGTGVYGTSGEGKLAARRGAVIVLGLDSAHPKSAAAHLLAQLPNLDYLALVGTPQTAEKKIAQNLLSMIAPACGRHLDPSHTRVWEFGAAESISDTEEAVTEALRWMTGRGLRGAQLIVDVSSGRRAMTYGAKDAADEFEVETQYLASAWDPATNRPIPGTAMFKIIKAYDA